MIAMTAATACVPGARRPALGRLATRLLAPAGLAGLLLLSPLGPAAATPDLAARLATLEGQAARLAARLDAAPFEPARPAPLILAQSGSLPEGYAAEVEVRLSRLEEQIRVLNGEIERLGYAITQTDGRLERALNDIDYRLTALEGGAPVAGGAPTGPGQAPTGPSIAAAPTAPADGDDGGLAPSLDGLEGLEGLSPDDPTADFETGTLGTLTVPGEPTGTGGASISGVSIAYQEAFGLLQRADYPGAERALQAFLVAYPADPLASDAQYWLGETYYIQGRYNDAAIAFAQGYQRYPAGTRAADSLLKLGMSLAALGQAEDACLTFRQLGQAFPDAPAAVARRAGQEATRLGCS